MPEPIRPGWSGLGKSGIVTRDVFAEIRAGEQGLLSGLGSYQDSKIHQTCRLRHTCTRFVKECVFCSERR